jgi:ribose 5-phosphate isomerase A
VRDDDKRAAAAASMAYVAAGQIVGLGTGSTAAFVIEALAERVGAGLAIHAVPTSEHTRALAIARGIPVMTLADVAAAAIDVTIDGADEIDPQLALIKGAGGALVREKIVAAASRRVVIVADASKLVPVLGRGPVPVAVVPFAEAEVARRITALGATAVMRRQAGDAVYVTDDGHHVLDCVFGPIPDPATLAAALDALPGVVEHGLFVGLATVALVAAGGVVETRLP